MIPEEKFLKKMGGMFNRGSIEQRTRRNVEEVLAGTVGSSEPGIKKHKDTLKIH